MHRTLLIPFVMFIPAAFAVEKIMPLTEMPMLYSAPEHEWVELSPVMGFVSEDQNKKCPGGEVAFIKDSQVIDIAIDDAGNAPLEAARPLFHKEASIRLRKADNAGKCALSVTMQFSAKKLARPLRYRDLSGLTEYYNTLTKASAGMWSFLAPDMIGVKLRHELKDGETSPVEITYQFDDGKTRTIKAEPGVSTIVFDRTLEKQNPVVIFSSPVIQIFPELEE